MITLHSKITFLAYSVLNNCWFGSLYVRTVTFFLCAECNCEAVGSVENTCGPSGQCLCRSNYAGLKCDQCAPGYYNYPICLCE